MCAKNVPIIERERLLSSNCKYLVRNDFSELIRSQCRRRAVENGPEM